MVTEQELTGFLDSLWLFSFKKVPQWTLLAEIVQIYLKCLKLPPPASLKSQGHGNDQIGSHILDCLFLHQSVCVCVRMCCGVLGGPNISLRYLISQKPSIFGLLVDCFRCCLFLRQNLPLVWNLWIRLVWLASKPWDLPISVSHRIISMSHHIWLFYMGCLNQIHLLQKWFV